MAVQSSLVVTSYAECGLGQRALKYKAVVVVLWNALRATQSGLNRRRWLLCRAGNAFGPRGIQEILLVAKEEPKCKLEHRVRSYMALQSRQSA